MGVDSSPELRVGVFGGDPWSDEMRNQIEDALESWP
jgi:phenylacetate-coenzyme A ligase PaaK-like adenylate-forming protein